MFVTRASELPRVSDDPDFPATLLGSWTTLYGPLDSAGLLQLELLQKLD